MNEASQAVFISSSGLMSYCHCDILQVGEAVSLLESDYSIRWRVDIV